LQDELSCNANLFRAITASAGIDVGPAWSPDWSSLAYTSTASGNVDVFTVGTDGFGQLRVTTNSGIDTSPSWAPDGSRIVYSSTHGLQVDLYACLPDGTGATRLTAARGIEVTPAWK
jgi:TolB protein